MDIHSLKLDLIHWLTELKDTAVLEKIQAIKNQEDYDLSPSQQEQLDARMKRYERGEMKFSAWDEVKGKIMKRSKDAL